jgi:hypothetical protein
VPVADGSKFENLFTQSALPGIRQRADARPFPAGHET